MNDTHIITRTENTQRENVLKTGLISEFDLKWLSDCRYILYNRRVIKGTDEFSPEVSADTLYNEITEVSGNRHTVISTMKKYNLTVKSTLVKQPG